MELLLCILGFALGGLAVLIASPVQLTPRFVNPIRHAYAPRGYRLWSAEWIVKQPFYRLTFTAAGTLVFLFMLSLYAPASEFLLLLRFLASVGLGAAIGWKLLGRKEIVIGSLGLVGFYPNPALVVSWQGLSGYLVQPDDRVIYLLNEAGEPVEVLPVSGEMERREVELALLSHLTRQPWRELQPGRAYGPVQAMLNKAYLLLALSVLPLALLPIAQLYGYEPSSLYMGISITMATIVPYMVFDWSVRYRWVVSSTRGHVQLAQVRMKCQRCFYHKVCWQGNLHRMVRWVPGGQAVTPTLHEYNQRRGKRKKLDITREVYQMVCCCLIAHMQEQDFYQVKLITLEEAAKQAKARKE